jgi:hypothetical protein
MISFSTNNGSNYQFNNDNVVGIWKGLSTRGRLVRIYTTDAKMYQFETGEHSSDISDVAYDNITLGEIK